MNGYDQFGRNKECDHDWEKWEERSQSGFTVILHGHQQGRIEYFDREWQSRICKKCGFRENMANKPVALRME